MSFGLSTAAPVLCSHLLITSLDLPNGGRASPYACLYPRPIRSASSVIKVRPAEGEEDACKYATNPLPSRPPFFDKRSLCVAAYRKISRRKASEVISWDPVQAGGVAATPVYKMNRTRITTATIHGQGYLPEQKPWRMVSSVDGDVFR